MIAALLLAVIAQQPQRDTRQAPATGTGTIAGTVSSADVQPRPLRRVVVMLSGSALPLPRATVTADDGSFAFERVPEGRFTVSGAKGGYVSMNYGATRAGRPGRPVQIAAGQSVTLALRLPRGGVITGTVIDAGGLPAQGIPVTALAPRLIGGSGERRLVAVPGTIPAATDDHGVYRIYGLPAGGYVVAAQSPQRMVGLGVAEVRLAGDGAAGARPLAMTAVYYPGASDVAQATPVTVAMGEERGGIDMQLQYVPLAIVSGTAAVPVGSGIAVITMVRADQAAGIESLRNSATDSSGRFTFNAVPPGQYRLLATSRPRPASADSASTTSAGPVYAGWAEIVVAGDDITSLSIALQPGLTISGRVVFEGERPAPQLADFSVPVPASLATGFFGYQFPRVQIGSAGTFKLEGVVPGPYRIAGAMQGVRSPIGGWWLKSLVIGGRNVLDTPLDLRQSTDSAIATFSDRASEIAGTVTDSQGLPLSGTLVVAFSTDRSSWFFNSIRIATAVADRAGRYSIRNLPPGDYRLAATTDLEPGEWFDPPALERLVPSTAPITVTGTEKITHDLAVR